MFRKVLCASVALMSVALCAMEHAHYVRVTNGEIHLHAYIQRQEQQLRLLKNKFCEQCQRMHGQLFDFCDVAIKNLEKFRACQPEIIEFSSDEELERILSARELVLADRVEIDMSRIAPCHHAGEEAREFLGSPFC